MSESSQSKTTTDRIRTPVCPQCGSENYGSIDANNGRKRCEDCGSEFYGAEIKYVEASDSQ